MQSDRPASPRTPRTRAKADIIARADQALYAAKHGGRNRTVCHGDIEKGQAKLKAVK